MIVESYEDTIILSGSLRSNYWETLHTAISLMLKRHPSGVIIDCSALSEATPLGAQTFRDVMEFIHNHDARVLVAAVPAHIREVLKSVTEVRSQLAIADTVEEARHSLDLLVEEKPSKRRHSNGGGSKIVVCLTGEEIDKEALHIASQLAEARGSVLHLVYVVVVPRDLPLTAPLPKEEGYATTAIDKARTLIDKHISYEPHIERGRDVPSALEDLIAETKCGLVVMPIPTSTNDGDGNAKLIKSVLSKIPQEVILVRGAVPGRR